MIYKKHENTVNGALRHSDGFIFIWSLQCPELTGAMMLITVLIGLLIEKKNNRFRIQTLNS